LHQDDNGVPVGIFLVIVMIRARFKNRWEASKNPEQDLPLHGYHSSGERKHTIHKAEHPHEEGELTEPGNKTDQKRDSQPEI
jgi:hypothetical protein